MTVKKLIALLQKFPADAKVKILMSDDFYGISEVVKIDEDFCDVAICSDEEL